MKMKVRDSLPFGRENAIPAKVLAEALGFPSDRELRWFTRTLNARAKNTAKAAQSAQEALDAATGQERMEGWWK